MRILTLTSSYPKYAGDTTAPFIASITRALAERGHELTMVLPARADLAPEPIPGVRFCPYRYAPTEGLSVFGYAEALRADVALKSATYLVAPLAILAGARRIAAEIRTEPYDVVHAHWVVPNGTIAWLGMRSTTLPLVVSLHGSDVFLPEKKTTFRAGAKVAFARASAATACSEDLATRSLAIGASTKPTVIPYGVDLEAFRARPGEAAERRRALGLDANDTVALAVGRLVHKKGFEYLVDAAGLLAERKRTLHVLIAGGGDLERELEARARERGIGDRVRFLGNVERDALPDYFTLADVIVVPSVRDEAGNVDGLPNVLLEAMASGKAIVATDVAGIPQAVRAGCDGLLVPEKDATALADAIEKLIQSPEQRASLGTSARTRAEDAFGWNLTGERFESVLRSVAEARRP